MARPEKAQAVEFLRDRFARMSSAVLVDYVGMNVEDVSRLRAAFRAKGIEYKVVKNTLVYKALEGQPWLSQLKGPLRGMTGIAWSFEEPSLAARILKEFRKEGEKPALKAGVLEGTVLDGRAVEEQLAALPSKDEARAMLLATLLAPAQHFVMLLAAPAREMVGVLAAKERQAAG
jgi:large subunit ribosomal protein L10